MESLDLPIDSLMQNIDHLVPPSGCNLTPIRPTLIYSNFLTFRHLRLEVIDRHHLAFAMLIALPLLNYLWLQSRHRWTQICLLAATVVMVTAAHQIPCPSP